MARYSVRTWLYNFKRLSISGLPQSSACMISPYELLNTLLKSNLTITGALIQKSEDGDDDDDDDDYYYYYYY